MQRIYPALCVTLLIVLLHACSSSSGLDPEKFTGFNSESYKISDSGIVHTVNTEGYWENGEVIAQFDCPDSQFFPPIAINDWNKVKAVSGRLPTYIETLNGTSIHMYNTKDKPKVKALERSLPKLAYFYGGNNDGEYQVNDRTGKLIKKPLLVVVIQMVQSAKDTLIGFRYLSGGCGGSVMHDFRLLNEDEIAKAILEYNADMRLKKTKKGFNKNNGRC